MNSSAETSEKPQHQQSIGIRSDLVISHWYQIPVTHKVGSISQALVRHKYQTLVIHWSDMSQTLVLDISQLLVIHWSDMSQTLVSDIE